MIAVDTNILVYAHREDSPWHDSAGRRIAELAEGRAPWAIPWPCIHEFLAIVTHPRIYNPPTTLALALDQVEAWLEAPSLSVLSETEGYWTELRAMVEAGKAVGGQVHDARISALCRLHGVRELWTADRDFSRFAGVRVTNPLIDR
jgi:toxin-antitoxin system PIN domain toxin